MTEHGERLKSAALRDDQPIRTIDQDILGRARLVEGLAAQIEATTTRDPMVIALNAPWGTGKSSFIRLLSDRLRSGPSKPNDAAELSDSTPIIIDFNPWMFGNVEELIRTFFAQLGREIGAKSDKGSDLADKLQTFGRMVVIVCPSPPPGLANLAAAATTSNLLRAFHHKKVDAVDIKNQQKTIDGLLKRLPKHVIVFVDDIDRLEPQNTELLFRMLRLCANFHNITYVLAFDSDAVERHLYPHDPVSGRRYLEKVTQVSYSIPRPSRTALRIFLQEELDDVIDVIATDSASATRPETRRYERMFKHGIEKHFITIRGVKRYVNALRLSLPPVKDGVDFVDFFVIELVRVVYPHIYLWLSDSRYNLLGNRKTAHAYDIRNRVKSMMDDWKMSDDATESLVMLLSDVFPTVSGGTETRSIPRGTRLRWARDGRACCREAIDRYFLFTIPDERLSERDQAGLYKALKTAVRQNGGETIEKVLERWARLAARKESAKGLLNSLRKFDPEDDLRLRDRDNDGQLLGDIIDRCITHQQGGKPNRVP